MSDRDDEQKTVVGTITANEYARLREAEAKVARVEALIAEFAARHKYVGSLIGGRRGDMNAREANTWLVAEADLQAALDGDEESR